MGKIQKGVNVSFTEGGYSDAIKYYAKKLKIQFEQDFTVTAFIIILLENFDMINRNTK